MSVRHSQELGMMSHSPAAFGLYPSCKALHFGAEALRAAQFRHTDISIMYSDGERALRLRESQPRDDSVADNGDGTSLGGILTSLSSIGALAMRDGPYMAGGPILSTLVHAGDSLSTSLRDLGIPEGEVECFQDRLKEGGLLLSVQCDDDGWADRARRILQETGAERIAATAA
jgi:hypothetical protein